MITTGAIQTETWPLARFIPYARNPRKNDHAVDRMAASIREFGFRVPVLARSSGDVIDGHLRLKAAEKLGMTEIPVIVCDDWSEAQVKAFRLLVNRSVTWADWDNDLLSLEMLDLRNLDYNIDLTGFDTHEIDEPLLAGSEDAHEDDAGISDRTLTWAVFLMTGGPAVPRSAPRDPVPPKRGEDEAGFGNVGRWRVSSVNCHR